MNTKTNGSNVWPYVVLGSAIGGAIGFLFMTESGRKVRRAITHPDELTDDIEGARSVIERKARVITDQVHSFIGKAEQSMEEGERAYREAGEEFRLRARRLERKNDEITSQVHNTVEKMNQTAVTIEHSVLDPICEMGALYRGIERGIRRLFGRSSERTVSSGPIPVRDRTMGF
jgi:gas vesicle protein